MKIKLILILLCLSFNGFAQNIQGKFEQQNFIDAGMTLTFNRNTFCFYQAGCLNGQTGTGNYSIKNQTLKLKFKTVKNQNSSLYSIISKPIDSGLSQIKIKLSDDQGPLFGTVALRAKDYSIIEQFHIDKEGDLSFALKTDKKIATLTIDEMGYYRVTIPISKLKNKQSQITVKLKPATMAYMEPQVIIYKIEKTTDTSLILSSNNEGKIMLKKVPDGGSK